MKNLVNISIVALLALVAVIHFEWIKHREADPGPPNLLELPRSVKKIHINVGPNYTPIHAPNDGQTAVIVVEANIGIANFLRESFQKNAIHAGKFFVINSAVSSKPLAGSIATFRYYNNGGASSSLSPVVGDGKSSPEFASKKLNNYSDPSSPGKIGYDFVPVMTLESIISCIPVNISISFLKIDTQGHDLSVVKSASLRSLRRIESIMSETYIGDMRKITYKGVSNDLKDWIPYMEKAGFKLTNSPPSGTAEWDAKWSRIN